MVMVAAPVVLRTSCSALPPAGVVPDGAAIQHFDGCNSQRRRFDERAPRTLTVARRVGHTG
jgi:hypothetical protein